MSANKNLHAAKDAKNDEFYTQLTDIEKELKHYKSQLKDKIIFCNCDDPEQSNFWMYFKLNFKYIGIRKLIATHYDKEKTTYKLELEEDENGEIIKTKTPLSQNGDFRSPECIEILKECDVVITNPPFSLFREYVAQLMEYEKKFLIIGNQNAVTYKEIFPLIKDNKIWYGYNFVKEFRKPDGTIQKFGNVSWFTNLDTTKRQEDIIFYKTYNETDYPKYDKYDAININKVNEIPLDYDGVMGVPITFIDKYNPNQFEIIGLDRYTAPKDSLVGGRLTVNNQTTYARILIKKKVQTDEDRT